MIPRSRQFIAILAGLLVLNLVISFITRGPDERKRVPYQPFFVEQVEAGNVKEISSQEDSIEGELKKEASYDPPGDAKPVKVTKFKTEVPTFIDPADLTKLLDQQNVVINAKAPDSGRSLFATLLLGFLPTILLVGFFIWLLRRQTGAGGGGVLGAFGRSSARRVKPGEKERVTFDDVSGIDDAEDELVEVVDFLKNPQRYTKLGARVPRGVLLYGPPGTGKTLLARAVAGEADAAFFSLSASEFIEAIVGVGASRVRDLFKQAKEAAPAIVFIDELDAIGRSRSGNVGGISGGHDEREQTLNQILTEMDGFEPDTSVIVLGATNRPEILDPALLRPGRFDRRIAVQPPDRKGRAEILKIHTRSLPLSPDVDLDRIASSTPGATGADLALLANEAALFAARRNHTAVQQSDFTDAIEKIILGAERQVVMSDADRRRTAYHESGHALVGMLTPGADPVRKVSIIPRGQALGVTLATPESDRFNYSRDDLLARIKVALGGRAAERGRLRRPHHRGGVGHPEPDADRPRHGGPLGDERRDRRGRRDGRPRGRWAAAGRGAGLDADTATGRRGGPANRGRRRARSDPAPGARARAARGAGQGAAGARDARPARRLRGGRSHDARLQRRRGGEGRGGSGVGPQSFAVTASRTP